jgi:hypothetical protein
MESLRETNQQFALQRPQHSCSRWQRPRPSIPSRMRLRRPTALLAWARKRHMRSLCRMAFRLGFESWDCPTFVLHGFVTAAVHAAVSCRSAVGTGSRKEWVSAGFRRSL